MKRRTGATAVLPVAHHHRRNRHDHHDGPSWRTAPPGPPATTPRLPATSPTIQSATRSPPHTCVLGRASWTSPQAAATSPCKPHSRAHESLVWTSSRSYSTLRRCAHWPPGSKSSGRRAMPRRCRSNTNRLTQSPRCSACSSRRATRSRPMQWCASAAPDEARNCAETDVELLLAAGAEVLLDRPPPAVVRRVDCATPTTRHLAGPIACNDRSLPPRGRKPK